MMLAEPLSLATARPNSSADCPQEADGQHRAAQSAGRAASPQTLFFKAASGNALTTFFAGFAFTMTTLPKISFFPALVAGFMRVLIWKRPGSMNIPVLETSLVAISARLPMTFAHCAFFNSHAVASSSAIAPLVMGLADAFVFMGAISCDKVGEGRK